MTWTWGNNPSNSDLDAVRLRIGDVNKDDQLLEDESINYFLAQYTGSYDVLRASIDACHAVAAKFARESTYRIGQVSETLSRKSEAYERLADRLTQELRRLAIVSAAAVAPHTADKETQEDDTSLVQPYIRRGMHDNT